jgi:hypothetical protein
LVTTLEDMRLVTTHNFSAGCAVGVLAVFHSPRYGNNYRQDVVHALQHLLSDWLSHAALETTALSDGLRPALHNLWQRFGGSRSLSVTIETTGGVTALIARAKGVLRRATIDVSVGGDDLLAACRALGFWGAASVVCAVKAPHKKAAAQVLTPKCVFGVIGLNQVATQASRWGSILSAWDPVSGAGGGRSTSAETLSIAQFLQSDDFLCSTFQGSVIAGMRVGEINPLKFAAQDALVEVFARQWAKSWSTEAAQSTLQALRILRPLFESTFRTEYDAAEGGWRTGVSGDGYRLLSRLENRRPVGVALLGKLPGVTSFAPSAMMTVLKPSLQWQHLSSCTGRKLLEYAQFVDHCALEVFAGWEPGAQDTAAVSEEDTVIKKLHAVCSELVALLALVAVENAAAVAVSSLRGLLRALSRKHAVIKEATEDTLMLVNEVVRCRQAVVCVTSLYADSLMLFCSVLDAIPAPWAGSSRADVQCEIQFATHAVLEAARSTQASTALRTLKLRCSMRTLQSASKMPAFVINLDKRTDR